MIDWESVQKVHVVNAALMTLVITIVTVLVYFGAVWMMGLLQ